MVLSNLFLPNIACPNILIIYIGKTVTSILEPTRTNQIIELIQSNPDSLSI